MMAYPVIANHQSGTSAWTYSRIGWLKDCVTCHVRQEYNTGVYELTMEYQPDGENARYLQTGNFVLCKTSYGGSEQAFRIEKISRSLSGLISVTAYHISYLHSNEICKPFLNGGQSWNAMQAWANAVNAIVNPSTGSKTCSITSTAHGVFGVHLLQPKSFRELIFDQLIPAYGGCVEWDGMNVYWKPETNPNRGVSLQGSVDAIAVDTDSDVTDVETGIFAFYGSQNDTVAPYQTVGVVDYGIDLPQRIIPMDFTSNFESPPTSAQLLNVATNYKNKRLSEIQPLQITVESIPKQEIILPGDTVKIRARQLGMDVDRIVTAIGYDVLHDYVDAVEVGTQKATLAKIIASLR